MADNGLIPGLPIVLGQALIILIPAVIHTVRTGETLFTIAEQYGTTSGALLRNNPWLTAEPELQPGRILTVRFTKTPNRTVRVNGYAYPFISQTLLRRTLPFLSTLTIFGYGFSETGKLIVPTDTELLNAAKNAGIVSILLLSSITENGNFDSNRANQLFRSPQLQNTVLSNILSVMQRKGYGGLDIDFEYVLPEDADDFLGFVQRAAQLMNQNGYFLHVDLAPKASEQQRGLLYEAHNYAALGAAANFVLLMTYEWGYTYGPPMAIAPIEPVREVVEFAVTQIPTEKILLGVPNYGYDWTLPFEKGITRAESIGNEYAVAVAQRSGAPIQYDEASQAPWFNYRIGGRNHVVWFEDVRSMKAKLDLQQQNNLRGIGVWNLMRPFSQSWALQSVTLTPTL